jgi:hypothetical protein
MTIRAYFQNPNAPDRSYEILSFDKENHTVTVKEDHLPHSFKLDTNLLKLLHWTIVKKDTGE